MLPLYETCVESSRCGRFRSRADEVPGSWDSARMSNHVETEEEIREEMEELGVSNDAEGSPDVLMSGPVLQVTVIILVLLLVAGSLLLIF